MDVAWTITVGNDARLAGTARARRPAARLVGWYMDRLHVAARRDPRVAAAFLRVANLLDAPPALVHPRVALRVLRGNRRAATPPRFAPIAATRRRRPIRPTPRPAPTGGVMERGR